MILMYFMLVCIMTTYLLYVHPEPFDAKTSDFQYVKGLSTSLS